MKVKVFMVSFKPFLSLRQQTLMVLLLCLLFGYSGCEGSKELAPKEVLDYIHIPHVHPTFEKADRFKYDVDYVPALETFATIWHGTQLRNKEDSMYCLNQIAYLNLCMYKDSVAHTWIQKADAMMAQYGDTMSPGARGDYWYNKGIWAFRTENPTQSDAFFFKALELLKYTLPYNHLRIAHCKTTIGLHHLEYNMSETHLFIKDANDVLSKPSMVKYGVSNLFAMAGLCKNDDEIDLCKQYCEDALRANENNKHKDVLIKSRILSLLGYAERKIMNEKKIPKIYHKIDSIHQLSIQLSNSENTKVFQEALNYYAYCLMDRAIDSNSYVTKYDSIVHIIRTVVSQHGRERYSFPDLLDAYYHRRNSNYRESIVHLDAFFRKHEYDSTTPSWFKEHALYMAVVCHKELNNFEKSFEFVKKDLLFGTKYEGSELTWNQLMAKNIQQLKNYQFVDYSLAAGIFLAKYRVGQNKQTNLKWAYQLYMLADSMLYFSLLSTDQEAILRKVKREGDQLYAGAIETLYELQIQNPENGLLQNQISRLIERRKAYFMFEHIKWTKRVNERPEFRQLMDSIRTLEYEISRCKYEQSLFMHLPRLTAEYDKKTRTLERNYPEYAFRKEEYLPNVEVVLNSLARNQVVLNYFIGKSSAFVFMLDGQTKKSCLIPLEKDIQKFVDSFYTVYALPGLNLTTSNKNSIFQDKEVGDGIKKYIGFSNMITKAIFPKNVQIDNREVIVIPDKSLHRLPFDALLNKNTPSNLLYTYKDLPYLFCKTQFSFSQSLKSYWKNRSLNPSSANIAAFGAEKFGKHLDVINQIFSDAVIFKKSNREYFFNNVNKFNTIHLSLHGSSISSKSSSCQMIFDDLSVLVGHELVKVHLDASLVVIASCQAAEGDYSHAEGAFSMARYFIQSGASCVVAPVYNIDGLQTTYLLKNFYRYIKTAKTPERALWLSKIEYIKEDITRVKATDHPYFWAGLQVYR